MTRARKRRRKGGSYGPLSILLLITEPAVGPLGPPISHRLQELTLRDSGVDGSMQKYLRACESLASSIGYMVMPQESVLPVRSRMFHGANPPIVVVLQQRWEKEEEKGEEST